jgi:predicted TIM-barrel fold metal-dependent hydrolase
MSPAINKMHIQCSLLQFQVTSHYWHNNCYATFQNDLLGLSQLDHLGAGRVMWASDYPHSEGSLGYGWESLQSVMDAANAEDARAILGGTATKVYKLHD